ncbi:hypothetical protein B4086_5642 [Bacillus cereus]|nr:hypothetical protein B4086_5642 [Bacillus cereus]
MIPYILDFLSFLTITGDIPNNSRNNTLSNIPPYSPTSAVYPNIRRHSRTPSITRFLTILSVPTFP